MHDHLLKIYLLTAGIALPQVGGFIAFDPASYLASLNPSAPLSTALLSDLRGMGSVLLALGLFTLDGAAVAQSLIYIKWLFLKRLFEPEERSQKLTLNRQ